MREPKWKSCLRWILDAYSENAAYFYLFDLGYLKADNDYLLGFALIGFWLLTILVVDYIYRIIGRE